MSGGSTGGAEYGMVLAGVLQMVFSLIFPITVLGSCLASYALKLLGFPEFGLWAWLAEYAFECAETNILVALGLGAFVLAAIPLAWVGLRERELRLSSTILDYVIAAMIVGFVVWLRTIWPFAQSRWQLYAYGFLLFVILSATVEVALGTIGIVAHFRQSPAPKSGPSNQQPHGNPRSPHPPGEPETI